MLDKVLMLFTNMSWGFFLGGGGLGLRLFAKDSGTHFGSFRAEEVLIGTVVYKFCLFRLLLR